MGGNGVIGLEEACIDMWKIETNRVNEKGLMRVGSKSSKKCIFHRYH